MWATNLLESSDFKHPMCLSHDGMWNYKDCLRPLSWMGTLITSAPSIGHYHPVFGKFSTCTWDPAVDVPQWNPPVNGPILVLCLSHQQDTDMLWFQVVQHIGQNSWNCIWKDLKLRWYFPMDYMSTQPTMWHINVAPIICEIKSELGQGSSNPSVHSFSYARFYCLNEVNQTWSTDKSSTHTWEAELCHVHRSWTWNFAPNHCGSQYINNKCSYPSLHLQASILIIVADIIAYSMKV